MKLINKDTVTEFLVQSLQDIFDVGPGPEHNWKNRPELYGPSGFRATTLDDFTNWGIGSGFGRNFTAKELSDGLEKFAAAGMVEIVGGLNPSGQFHLRFRADVIIKKIEIIKHRRIVDEAIEDLYGVKTAKNYRRINHRTP